MNLIKVLLFFLVGPSIWGTQLFLQQVASSSIRDLSKRETIFHTKIVGGLPANPQEFPYQLSLRRRNGGHFCGASLIKVKETLLAVTAAHCVDSDINSNSFVVVGGDVKISDTSGHEQTRKVAKTVIHEEYSGIYHPKGIFNDVALLFLEEPFIIDSYVNVIKLPEFNQETEGMLIVSGWGTTESGGDIPDDLQYIEIPVVSQNVCQTKWKNNPLYPMVIGDGVLCAGVDDGEKSTCHGDSGGPAVSYMGSYLAGIVSFGDPSCGHPDYPGGFTNVSFYVK